MKLRLYGLFFGLALAIAPAACGDDDSSDLDGGGSASDGGGGTPDSGGGTPDSGGGTPDAGTGADASAAPTVSP